MKVLLIDDHPLFREGLALLLRPLLADLDAWFAASCDEAIALLEDRGAADLALVDLVMPGARTPGLQGIGLLRERWPQMTVVALSSADDRETVFQAIQAGAMGFIPKSSTTPVLQAALNLILVPSIYLPPSVLGETAAALPGASGVTPAARCTPADLGLTERQADVLYLILQGMVAKKIEAALHLAESTVKQHTSAVLRALKVSNRTQAVVAAGRLGLAFPQKRFGGPSPPEPAATGAPTSA